VAKALCRYASNQGPGDPEQPDAAGPYKGPIDDVLDIGAKNSSYSPRDDRSPPGAPDIVLPCPIRQAGKIATTLWATKVTGISRMRRSGLTMRAEQRRGLHSLVMAVKGVSAVHRQRLRRPATGPTMREQSLRGQRCHPKTNAATTSPGAGFEADPQPEAGGHPRSAGSAQGLLGRSVAQAQGYLRA